MSEEGFGDLTNDYVRALANYTPPGSSTAYLYAGTLNHNVSAPPSLSTDGCEVWRTDGTMVDGKHVWEEVVGPSETQKPAGFNEGCSDVRWMKVINCSGEDLLWVGTSNPFIGCEIWVTNGTDWKRANIPGFDLLSNNSRAVRGVAIFNNTLFVGTLNPNEGAGVWRYNRSLDTVNFATLDTPPNLKKWEQVNLPGFGKPEVNIGVGVLKTFGAAPDYLYAGTWSGTLTQLLDLIIEGNLSDMNGSQVWRTNGTLNGTGPDLIWEQIEDNGFGDNYNGGILSSIVFNGSLYMGTMNFNNGAEIWRTRDGVNWTSVTTIGFKDIAGFKAFGNGYMWCMFNYSDMLFVGTMNPIFGCQVWRSPSGEPGSFEQVNINGMNNERTIPLFNILGFPVTGIDQYGVRSFEGYNGSLYLGTASFGAFLDRYIEEELNCTANFSE
jgi:hypothetical protein